jgi:hypothetical protein
MIKHCLKGIAAAALALGVSACGSNMHVSIGDDDGVPLSELDLSGEAPTKLALASPDKVVVVQGDKLDIKVSGDADAIEALRFNIEDGRLGIMRERDSKVAGTATVAVTMPAAREFDLLGSGNIEAPAMVDKAEVNIAGSGNVAVARMAAERLQVNVMGSGTLSTAGTAERLDFNVAGSGKLAARGLKVESAEVNIAGSGGGEFASDGRVSANVAGSGDVTVYGRADCKITALGSGKLRCVTGESWDDAAPETPKPPVAAKAPAAPEPPAPAE